MIQRSIRIVFLLTLLTISLHAKDKKDIGIPIDKDSITARVLEKNADLRQDVALAIRGAVRGLIATQRKDGKFGPDHNEGKVFDFNSGPTALAIYALAATWLDGNGADKGLDKLRRQAVKKGIAYLDKHDRFPDTNYEINCLIMALEAAGDLQTGSQGKDKRKRNPYKQWIERLANKILGYEHKKKITARQKVLLNKTSERAYKLQKKWLLKKGGEAYLKKYGKRRSDVNYGIFKEYGAIYYTQVGLNNPGSDLSNMQYSILGLKAASRVGVKIKKEFWRRMLVYFLTAQKNTGKEVDLYDLKGAVGEDATGQKSLYKSVGNYEKKKKIMARGFPYTPYFTHNPKAKPSIVTNPTDSMTTSGLGGLLICRSELRDDKIYQKYLSLATDLSIDEGMAFLGQCNLCTLNNGQGFFRYRQYYVLYGVERVGVMGGVETFGKQVWFRKGCESLLKVMIVGGKNKEQAIWRNSFKGSQIHHIGVEGDRIVNSSFALLFLGRATLPLKIPRTYTIVESAENSE